MRKRSWFLCCGLVLFIASTGLCTPFDERLWEKYFEIRVPSGHSKGHLSAIYLDPLQFVGISTNTPFSDLRVITDRKEEVPWHLIVRRADKRSDELPARIHNLSQTEGGHTWLELFIDKPQLQVNAVEINTPDTNFSRQIQILGSPDGRKWNTLRKDGVIFDNSRFEKIRLTRISFPNSSFRHLALKINNDGAPSLTIKGVNVLLESDSKERTYWIDGKTEKPEITTSRQESSVIIKMNTVFPIDRLVIDTTDRNFQRSVEVQVKKGSADWKRWTQGTIFRYDTPTMKEANLAVEMPEIMVPEFRLVFKNFDSPPLPITSVHGEGYRRVLIFKQQPDRKLYLFWDNPLAQRPQYDLAGLVAKQKLDEIPLASLGQVHRNTKFAGNKARLPFTERHKYWLYLLIVTAIGGLLFLQFRVLKKWRNPNPK